MIKKKMFIVSCPQSRPRGAIGVFGMHAVKIEALDVAGAEGMFRRHFECNRKVEVKPEEAKLYKVAPFTLFEAACKFAHDYEKAGYEVVAPVRKGQYWQVQYRRHTVKKGAQS